MNFEIVPKNILLDLVSATSALVTRVVMRTAVGLFIDNAPHVAVHRASSLGPAGRLATCSGSRSHGGSETATPGSGSALWVGAESC